MLLNVAGFTQFVNISLCAAKVMQWHNEAILMLYPVNIHKQRVKFFLPESMEVNKIR